MTTIAAFSHTVFASTPLAATGDPAGGAAIGQVVLATAAAMVATGVLVYYAWAHRTGRTTLLHRIAERAAAGTGLAPWAALPTVLATSSLLVAVFGMYWDISLHIDQGRDPGPLANPAHYFILAGLFGIFAAGLLAVVLPEERPGPSAVRISGDWYAPVGGVVLLACSSFALAGFPLDDVWHRLFGQDVTLWGPTHLMLIGGAGLSLLGIGALNAEGRLEGAGSGTDHSIGVARFVAKHRASFACGGLLIGLSTFQAEFDFGVPQFRLLFQPILIAFAAGMALVVARMYAGRGGALAAAGFFILVRGGLALLVGPVLGETTPHLPLYLVEAGIVELVALAIPPQRGYSFGAVCGALIGTIGFAAEYGWSQIWMPIAWPQALIAEALPLTIVAGIAAGLLGAFVGRSFTAERYGPPAIAPAAVGLVALLAIVGYGLQTGVDKGVRASFALDDVQSGPQREVAAKIKIDPPSAAEDADWLNVTAWQGGGLVVDSLRKTGPGAYETTEPIPVYGDWKSTLRLQKRDSIAGLPIYLPADPAIPVDGIPAVQSFSREFILDRELLQREQKQGVSPVLPPIAYAVVGSIALFLILLLGWALSRLGRGAGGGGAEQRARRRVAPGVPATGGGTA